MKIVSWNFRGCGRDGFLNQTLYFVKLLSMNIFYLLDTIMNYDSTASLAQAFNFEAFEIIHSHGQCGGIILFYNNNKFNLNMVSLHDWFLYCQIHDFANHVSWHSNLSLYDPSKGKPSSSLGHFITIATS